MRRLTLLLAAVSLLAGLAGCQVKTGVCDCVDLPPPVATPYGGPGAVAPGVVPVPAAPIMAAPAAPMPEQIPVRPVPLPNK